MTQKSFSFDKNDDVKAALRHWWEQLEQRRGDRARLRRCHTPADIMLEPAYYLLLNELQALGLRLNESGAERIAVIAGLLAYVEKPASGADPLAKRMAKPADKPVVSGLRFRRLLQADDMQDLYPRLRRALIQVDGAADIADLANSVYWWGDRVRIQWAQKYYETNSKAE